MSTILLPYDDGSDWVGEKSLLSQPNIKPVREKNMEPFKQAYNTNNVTIDALKRMSNNERGKTPIDGKSSIILPINGTKNLQNTMEDSWGCVAPGNATLCVDKDRSFVDRLGRKVKVYTSCMPPAQKDHGIEKGNERLRKSLGQHAIQKSKKEMSNDDVRLARNDDIGLDVNMRSRLGQHLRSNTDLNGQHSQKNEIDWERSKIYDGYNLAQGNETRAKRLDKTQRGKYEKNTVMGLNSKSQRFDVLPIRGSAIPRKTQHLGVFENINLNAQMVVKDEKNRALIYMKEPSARALPGMGVMNKSLEAQAHSTTMKVSGRDPTERVELVDAADAGRYGLTGTELGKRRDIKFEDTHRIENPLQESQGMAPVTMVLAKTSLPKPQPGSNDAFVQPKGPYTLIKDAESVPVRSHVNITAEDARDISDKVRMHDAGVVVAPERSKVQLSEVDSNRMPSERHTDHILSQKPSHGSVRATGNDSMVQQWQDDGIDIGMRQRAEQTLYERDDYNVNDWEGRTNTDHEGLPMRGRHDLKDSDDTAVDNMQSDAAHVKPKWEGRDDNIHRREVESIYDVEGMGEGFTATDKLPSRSTTYIISEDAYEMRNSEAGGHSTTVYGKQDVSGKHDSILPEGGIAETDRTAMFENMPLDMPVEQLWISNNMARENSDQRGLQDRQHPSTSWVSEKTGFIAPSDRSSTRGTHEHTRPVQASLLNYTPVLPEFTPESCSPPVLS